MNTVWAAAAVYCVLGSIELMIMSDAVLIAAVRPPKCSPGPARAMVSSRRVSTNSPARIAAGGGVAGGQICGRPGGRSVFEARGRDETTPARACVGSACRAGPRSVKRIFPDRISLRAVDSASRESRRDDRTHLGLFFFTASIKPLGRTDNPFLVGFELASIKKLVQRRFVFLARHTDFPTNCLEDTL